MSRNRSRSSRNRSQSSRKRSPSPSSQFRDSPLDVRIIQNPEYHEALRAISPLVEQNLIRLTKNELPFEDAFRVMKKNMDVTPRQISYVNDMFKIPPSIIPSPEVSCLLHHLYPQWYAANRNTVFIYIHPELNETHYRRMPLASFGNLRFLRLHLPIHELKGSFGFIGKKAETWNDVMRTPDDTLENLRTISTVDDLSSFIDEMVNPSNPNPIDATFIQEFNEACDRLNVTDEKEYLKIATKISICGKFYTEGEFLRTNWYNKVFELLRTREIIASIDGISDVHAFVHAFIIAVAHVDIITPLSLKYIMLKFVNKAILPTPTNITQHELDQLKQQLKQLCIKDNLHQSEITSVVELLHPTENHDAKSTRIRSLMEIWNSYNVLAEVETNKHNFGIMNTLLTRALIAFFQQWYLKEVSSEGGEVTTMFHALVNNIKYTDMKQSDDALKKIKDMITDYGNVFRHSNMEPDFEFALCLNILLNHLYPGSNAGYYIGQIMCKNPSGGLLTTMNAELTIQKGLNYDPVIDYKVRKVRKIASGFETASDSDGGRRRRKTIKRKQRRTRGNKTKRIH
jgi:hypothetical protein